MLGITATISSRIRCLSPYRNAGLSNRRAKLIHANALGGGRDYQFHPDGIRTLEIRSLGHSNFRSIGLHTNLGTGAHSALIGRDLEVLAIAAQGNWLLRSSRRRRTSPSRRTSPTRRRSPPRRTSPPQSNIFQRKTNTPCGSAPPDAELYASDITLAH